jgi:putative ABC transport system permease protein
MKRVYSFYLDAFRIAIQSIFEHKLRAFLTLIGIIIGVASVVVVGASVSGLNSYVTQKIQKILGANHFMIARIASNSKLTDDEFEVMNRRNKKLTLDEYEYLKANCKSCSFVGGQAGANADFNENGVEMPAVQVFGVTSSIEDIADKELSAGRWITEDEDKRQARVCVIGTEVQQKYFPNGDAVGKSIKLRGIPLQIIGVEDANGTFFGQSLDRQMFIPLSLHLQTFGSEQGIQLHGKTADKETFQTAIDEARQVLKNKRQLMGNQEETFSLVDVEGLNNQIDQFTNLIGVVVVPITMITLIVGGIVVMNIMLVSVTERTFEVGLRKALGATRKQILLQFLIESSLLCIVGGIIGLLLAFGVTTLITILFEITMTVTLFYIVIAPLISSIIGVVAGLYPAFKASKLDPIIALTQN